MLEQRQRRLRIGVRIKLNKQKSFDENETEPEDCSVRLPLLDSGIHNFHTNEIDLTPGIIRQDSISFLRRLNSKSPVIRKVAQSETMPFVR